MTTQSFLTERRQKVRYGILERVEDITYTLLRKYGIQPTKHGNEAGVVDHTPLALDKGVA